MKSILKQSIIHLKQCLLLLFLIGVVCNDVQSQDVLKLEDVIKLVIENNFDIEIAKNDIQVAKNNNNIGLVGGSQSTGGTVSGGNTGMLPQISVAAGSPNSPLGIGQTVSTLKYSDPALNVSGQTLTNTSYAPSIIGTWYFFDGLKMFATKKKLNRNEELSNIQYRVVVENTLLTALTSYYQMISIEQYIKSLQTSLKLGEDQKTLASQKFQTGSGSKVDVLQTQIDYNNIQAQIMQQQNLLNEQRINLNNVLKRDIEVEFTVPDTIIVESRPNYEEALERTKTGNNSILVRKKTIEIDKLGLKEFKGNRYPKIGVTGNYTYQRVSNDIGLQRLNENYGYNVGLLFSWTILNNLTTNTAIKNQMIQIKSDQIRLEAAQSVEHASLYKAYLSFQNNLNIMELERQSVQLANENLLIASKRFAQGASTYIEYRTVEQSYEDAQYRLAQAAYNTKLSELNYLKVQGLLVY
ncbi:MAG TPA: TolC family protein [Cytophagaceae bacterium]|jgi:outer membrane protein|nr:TolC family protein [Cytophagaceae bacterium]